MVTILYSVSIHPRFPETKQLAGDFFLAGLYYVLKALCTVKIAVVFFLLNLESGLAKSLSDVFQASDCAEILPSALKEPNL